VRELFLNVNTLVNNFKKLFLKAFRIEIYKYVMPNVALPPEPYSPGGVLGLKQLPFVLIILNSLKLIIIEKLKEKNIVSTKKM
jgi:hypothetical protein